jgi:hypothetical protein
MAASVTVNTIQDDYYNNDLFGRLPFLADALLPLLDSTAVLQLSSTCQAWRTAVQLRQLALAPKSELSMPFVAGCLQLRHLQLSHMQPAHKGMSMLQHQQRCSKGLCSALSPHQSWARQDHPHSRHL